MKALMQRLGEARVGRDRANRANDHDDDHCHTSQKIRALLCGDCNTSFGLLKEDPERIQALLAYAKQWQGVTFAKL
jgi:Recombination endonuclease VII